MTRSDAARTLVRNERKGRPEGRSRDARRDCVNSWKSALALQLPPWLGLGPRDRRRAASPHHPPASLIDAMELGRDDDHIHRLPLQALEQHGSGAGLVLLLDHTHADARELLASLQRRHAARFASGGIVVGIEHAPRDDDAALVPYRRITPVPVFAVDLQQVHDRLLLAEALVATRVVAARMQT